jgi:hypothetical protein
VSLFRIYKLNKCYVLLLFTIMAVTFWTQSNEVYALSSQVIEKPLLNETVDNVSEPITKVVETPSNQVQEVTDEKVEPILEVVDETVDPILEVVDETIDPAIEVIDETIDPMIDVVDETTDPVIEVIDETVDPIINVVDETVEPIADVVDETNEQAIEVVNESADKIVKVDEETTKGTTINGWLERISPSKSEQDSTPIPIHSPLTNNSSKIVLNNNVLIGTGSSTSENNGFTHGNLLAFIKGQNMLSKSIMVTRNYAKDFILINQWSNAPPGQPPKVTSSQPYMN